MSISNYRGTLFKVAKQLCDEEVKDLLFLCKEEISQSLRETVKSAKDFIEVLEKKNFIAEDNLKFLQVLLKEIGRPDLIKLLPDSAAPGNIDLMAPGAFAMGLAQYRVKGSSEAVSHQGPLVDGLTGDGQGPHSRKSLPAVLDKPDEKLPPRVASTPGSSGSSAEQKWALDALSPHPVAKKSSPIDQLVQNQLRDLSLQDADDLQTDSPSLAALKERAPVVSSRSPLLPSAPGGALLASSPRQQLASSAADPFRSPPAGNQSRDLSTLRAVGAASCRQAARPREGAGATPNAVSPIERPLSSSSGGLATDSPASPPRPGASREVRPPDGAAASVRHLEGLMDQQEAREEARDEAGRAIPTLRGYQRELAHPPLDAFENYIICAPTGSGKTLTAAFICREYWTWFMRERRERHYKTLFIVNMRHLTRQQRDAFQKYFPERGAIETVGDQEILPDALKVDKALPLVLMVTAQVFVNALKSRSVRLEDVAMIVFDECHHTDLKHPYNEIMKRYLKTKRSAPVPPQVGVSGERLPFVIGLSASLGVGGDPMEHLLKLCANMDAMGVARVLANVGELEWYVNSPASDSIRRVSLRPEAERRYGRLLEELMGQIGDELPAGVPDKQALSNPGTQIYEGESMKRLIHAQEAGDRKEVIVYMYLYQYNRALMLYEDLRVADSLAHLVKFHEQRRMANQERVRVEEQCGRLFQAKLPDMKQMSREEPEHSNQMLAELAFRLQEVFTEKPESKGIILVRTKLATVALADFIGKSTVIKALPCPVNPLRFVGQGDIEDGCMTEVNQRNVLESFREDDGCNVLVATDIAQEGLDMPACNFVIRYNFVSNEIGTVQSKGRARAKGSNCYLIVESDSLNEKREMDNRYRVLQMMEAMTNLEAMTECERMQKITKKQDEIMEKIRLQEEEAALRQRRCDLDEITLHCKECSTLICKASELRRKGDAGHVSCIRPNFGRQIREVRYNRPKCFRDSETLGLVYCATPDCRGQLGTIQNFLLLNPPRGYALKAQSFKVRSGQGEYKNLKQWKKAGFGIPEEGAS